MNLFISKAVSYAIWHPDIARTEVTVARGIHFANMGHSAPRSVVGEDGVSKTYKRVELLPEEAIYLIERGALFCWKATNLPLGQIPGLSDILGSPMSVQQAYSEMIGAEGITLEKLQVRVFE
jgi:tRNA-splicing endonuclease subunit Sen54